MWKWGWKCEQFTFLFSSLFSSLLPFFSPPSPIQHRITSNDRGMAAAKERTEKKIVAAGKRTTGRGGEEVEKNSSRHRNEQQHFILWDVDVFFSGKEGGEDNACSKRWKSFIEQQQQKKIQICPSIVYLLPHSLSATISLLAPHDKWRKLSEA